MDKTLQALFALLQAGLWGTFDEAAASAFPLSAGEWERVFTLARQQTVTGIAFRGLDFLPEESYARHSLLTGQSKHALPLPGRKRES